MSTDSRDIEVLAVDPDRAEGSGGMIGGPAVPPPITPEDVAAVTDGSLAGKLRAVGERLQHTTTKDFPIPGTPLVLRARAFKDGKAFQRGGIKTEAFIIRSTAGLFLRDDDTDELTEIPTWGTELAGMLGLRVENASDLVRRLLDNPVRVDAFAAELIDWMAGRADDDEQALGE